MDSTASAPQGSKTVARSTAASHKFQVSLPSVEVVVFSPEQDTGWFSSLRELTTNPGHVALKIDDTLYNFGRYWKECSTATGGCAILRKDSASYIQNHAPQRSWVYGFVVRVNSRKPIMDAIDALWDSGKGRPGRGDKDGRRVGEYSLLSNSCKTFTLGMLTTGGVSLPSYFDSTDYPETVRDNFLRWQKEAPDVVIAVNTYKADPDLKQQKP